MTILRLTALRSDDTLGFLAALGVVELLRSGTDLDVRLGWEGIGGCALVDIALETVDDLAGTLVGLARSMSEAGRIIPANDARLVPKALSTVERRSQGDKVALDPLKMAMSVAVARFDALQAQELSGNGSPDALWLSALVSQLAAARPRESDERRLTPLYAASGQMTVHQLVRDALDDVLRRPERVAESLTGWRREKGTGGNLDDRALVDGAAGSAGVADNRAVLGATWLALHAIPWFTQVGDGRDGEAVLWVRDRDGSSLTWPVWTRPLDVHAMRALFRHALCRLVPRRTQRAGPAVVPFAVDAAHRTTARALGVDGVLRAHRRSLSKSAGPLRQPQVVWTLP